MKDKQKGMIYGAFLGDSHALGVHWIYNTGAIDKKAGRVTDLIDPIAKTFHPNRKAGEFTHYGDQMLLFLKHVHDYGGFDRIKYLSRWKEFFDSYDGYKDHAMKDTRENLDGGNSDPGSNSTDLAGIFYAPVLLAFEETIDGNIMDAAASAVSMTHNNPKVTGAARFFSAVLRKVLQGAAPVEGVESVLKEQGVPEDISGLVRKGLDSIGKDTRETIKEFGQACPADHGIPGVIHLIGSYEEDFEKALIENVMAGGDSAARGIITGAVLGAGAGTAGIPERWMNGLKAKTEIENLLS